MKAIKRRVPWMKVCSKCKAEKPISEFFNCKITRDSLSYWCKACSRKYSDNWRLNNPQKFKHHIRVWREKHPVKVNEYKHNWILRNPEKRKQIGRDAYKKIYSSLMGNLNHRMRTAIQVTLRKNKAGRHWEELVGYTLQELKKHLESQFKGGMSWNNRNKWHIDHIIPLSFFEFKNYKDQEFQYCWSLDNLQPMWATDNLKKWKKII